MTNRNQPRQEETDDKAAPYSQKFLKEYGVDASYQFLEDCTYKVDLKQLYLIKSTCYFNVDMPYCPVLVGLKSEKLIEFYSKGYEDKFATGVKFLLQVWDDKQEKVFEEKLEYEVTVWNIFYQYFIYKPSSESISDPYHDCFLIVNLKKRNTPVIRVQQTNFDMRDIKFIAYFSNVLYVASSSVIQLAKVADDYDDTRGDQKEQPSVLIDESQISKIELTPQKVHGFFINKEMTLMLDEDQEWCCILVALETDDKQVDLNTFHMLSAPGSENFKYQFKQYRPLVPRMGDYSPIEFVEKYQLIFHEVEDGQQESTSAALRSSGKVDFYHQGMLCPPQKIDKEKSFEGTHIELSFDETFVKPKDEYDATGKITGSHVKSVSHELESRMSISESRDLDPEYKISNVFFQRIKNHCQIFKGFVFLDTYIFVAHGAILSLYDIIKLKFTKHIQFQDDIHQVFRSKASNNSEEAGLQKDESFDVCVLLEDGKIKFINQRKYEKPVNSYQNYEDECIEKREDDAEEKEDDYKIDPTLKEYIRGKILQFDQDRDDNEWTFMLVQGFDGSQISLQCLYDQKIYYITDCFKDFKKEELDLTEDTNFTFLFSPKDITEVLIHQKGKEGEQEMFYVYEISFDKRDHTVRAELKEGRANTWTNKALQEKDQKEETFVTGELHAGIRVRKEKGHMILADQTYFYVIDMSSPEEQPQKFKQMCAGLFLSDNSYMYTLSHKNPETGGRSGFRLYDLENCISKVFSQAASESSNGNDQNDDDDDDGPKKKKKQGSKMASNEDFLSYHLQSVQVGCQRLIDFSHQNQRLVYQSSYESIDVVPVMHRNTISFVGMSNRDQYLATKVIDDKFIALNKKNELTTWSITTGQVKKVFKLNQDYTNFEIYTFSKNNYAYHQDWAHRVLLKSKTQLVEQVDEVNSKFFMDSMITPQIKQQTTYVKALEKTFYEFRLIEIISDKEVKEHLSYIFPYYGGDKYTQYMFFSDDMNFMLERLINARAFLYLRESAGTREQPNRVRWLPREDLRLSQFPIDLAKCTQYPFMFSPNFQWYLDIDRKGKKFLIKSSSSLNGGQSTYVPDHIMNCKIEPHEDVAARFMWVENDTLKIISKEGIERKIRIVKSTTEENKYEFKEIAFNVIPLFDEFTEMRKEAKTHYFYNKGGTTIEDTLSRLQVKYQAYKSACLLEGKQQNQLYPVLFTVDYGLDDYKGRYVADLSFSFLHWNLMEKLEKNEIQVDKIDLNQFKKLIYTILPRGETIFHRLTSKGTVIIDILRITDPIREKDPDQKKIEVPIPFIERFDGQSPLDILELKKDFRTINQMLPYLAAYGIDHHSRSIVKILPACVANSLPNLNAYIQSRMLQTKQCLELTKGNLTPNLDPPGVCVSSYCMSTETATIIDTTSDISSELKLQFFDIPILHQYDYQDEKFKEFFTNLAETEDMALFQNKGIQMLIEYRWPLVKEYVIKKLFMPFVFFLINFILYMGYIYEWREINEPIYQTLNYSFMASLMTLSTYFIGIEIYQLFQNGLSYFKSVWNYLDLIPPILLMTFIPLAFTGFFDQIDGQKQNQSIEASLQATMSLLLWLKFLYFLRIFNSTGYLIKIIVSVCIDMRHFLFILFLTMMAFGDAMRQMSAANHPQHQFIQQWWQSFTYIYRMSLGDFNPDPTNLEGGHMILPEGEQYSDPNSGFGVLAPYYVWGLFYFCTVLNMIIMLNLLIAIISESFSKINQQKEQASFQEKCDIMAENTYLVPNSRKVAFCTSGKYLLIATDIQKEYENQSQDPNFLIKETAKKIITSTEELEKRLLKEISELRSKNEKSINSRMDKIIDDNKLIIELLNKAVTGDNDDN